LPNGYSTEASQPLTAKLPDSQAKVVRFAAGEADSKIVGRH